MYIANALKQLGMLFNFNEFYFFLNKNTLQNNAIRYLLKYPMLTLKRKKLNIFKKKNKVRIFISWYFINTFYFHKYKKEECVHMNQI